MIVVDARRGHANESLLGHFGDDRQEFCNWLDFVSCDLSCEESLMKLHDDSADTTYFLSVPPTTYADAISNLKKAGFLDDPARSRVVIEKPFGSDIESADNLQSVVSTHLREKQV